MGNFFFFGKMSIHLRCLRCYPKNIMIWFKNILQHLTLITLQTRCVKPFVLWATDVSNFSGQIQMWLKFPSLSSRPDSSALRFKRWSLISAVAQQRQGDTPLCWFVTMDNWLSNILQDLVCGRRWRCSGCFQLKLVNRTFQYTPLLLGHLTENWLKLNQGSLWQMDTNIK